jgi:hypothetical protein
MATQLNIPQTCLQALQHNEDLSSDDDFKSARSQVSSGIAPSAEGDVLVDEDSRPSDSTSDLHNPLSLDEIRAPKTCGNDGKPLLFDSLDLCFDHLQEEAKRCGFAVKKSTSKKRPTTYICSM